MALFKTSFYARFMFSSDRCDKLKYFLGLLDAVSPLRLELPRPPLLIFLSLILISLILGSCIIYSTVSAHRKGDYLHLESDVLEVDFPANWFAFSWETVNETTNGKIFSFLIFASNMFSAISIQVFDENATRQYMMENNLSDVSSASFKETQRLFKWISRKNENASIISSENGTLIAGVSKSFASFTRILIKDGFEDRGSFYNVSCTVISYMEGKNLVRIAFWGKDEDCDKASGILERILNTTLVKSYGSKR